MNLNRLVCIATFATCVVALPTLASAATPVISNTSTPTLIGALLPGQNYSVTTTGIVDLAVGFNGGNGLTFTADGKPTYVFPSPYTAFSPNGLDYDPSAGPSSVGPGGAGRLLGSLLGTFSATPSAPADFFVIGLGTTVSSLTGGPLYALVNDTVFGDNSPTGFSVTVTAVPEPGTVMLMLAGLGIVAGVARRRPAA